MLARKIDAVLQAAPRGNRPLWLWVVLGALVLLVALLALKACAKEERPSVAPDLGDPSRGGR